MKPNITTLERAFQLARSGEFASVPHVRLRLAAEGYAIGQISGPGLVRQLRALCDAAGLPNA